MKQKKTWASLIISAVFLYLAFRKSEWSEIADIALNARFEYFLLAMPLMLLSFVLRAVRWRYLLLPAGRPSIHSLFSAVMIGYMSLNLLPLRLGEFVRAYVLGQRENISKSGAFATIVVERIFDGFTLLFMLLFPLFFMPLPISKDALAWISTFSYFALAVYILAAIFLIMVKVKTSLIIRITDYVLSRFPALQKLMVGIIKSFSKGLDSVADMRLFLITTFLSLLVWAAYAGFYYVTMFAFQSPDGAVVGSQAGVLGSIFVLVAIALGVMIPSSPGFVGVYELAAITSLVAIGVAKSTAESYAILVHAVQFVPVTLIGILYLYLQNFTLKEIRAGGENTQTELEPAE